VQSSVEAAGRPAREFIASPRLDPATL